MTQINLLPWREARRQQKQRRFYSVLALAAVVTAGAVAGTHMVVQREIDAQRARNAFLQTAIAQVNQEIQEIKELEATKTKLLAHMELIEELQANRPQVVHVLNALVDTLPEGVHLRRFERKGSTVQLSGLAQSNGHISEYMRNLDGSDWFHNPDLGIIQTRKEGPVRISQFELRVTESTPQPPKPPVRTAAR